MKTKYAFIDRDGTLIYEPTPKETKRGDIPYQIDAIKKLRILPGVIDGLHKIIDTQYTLIMTSNQDGLGTTIYPQECFDTVQKQLVQIFKQNGVSFETLLLCPHMPDDNCNCRKPKTKLFDNFLRNRDVDKELSFVCGDRESDRLLAKNLGLRFLQTETNQKFTLENFKL
ncbi:MAG: histidinol-phosphatase [Candidatus Magasanikbacteria bacterium]